jgi:hypothetical protein
MGSMYEEFIFACLGIKGEAQELMTAQSVVNTNR